MSRDFDHISKEIIAQNVELFNKINVDQNKDISEIKKTIKGLETKIKKIDNTLEKVYDILQEITVIIDEANESGYSEEDEEPEENWTPYDDFGYGEDEENEEEDED